MWANSDVKEKVSGSIDRHFPGLIGLYSLWHGG